MKKTKISLMAISAVLTLIAVFATSCNKSQIIDDSIKNNKGWKKFYVDSIGIKHNVYTQKFYNFLKNSKNKSYTQEEIYYIFAELISEDYEIDSFPAYNDVIGGLNLIKDTNITFVEKYKTLNPNYSDKQLSYIIKIDNKMKNNSDNFESDITAIEEQIINDNTLTDSEKGELINLTDVAKNSYNLWEKEFNENGYDFASIWWVIGADAAGALFGGITFPCGEWVIFCSAAFSAITLWSIICLL